MHPVSPTETLGRGRARPAEKAEKRFSRGDAETRRKTSRNPIAKAARDCSYKNAFAPFAHTFAPFAVGFISASPQPPRPFRSG
jgi:hypothetical protein